MSDGLPYSLGDIVSVIVGVFAATAISIIICIISSNTNDELDAEFDVVELDDFQTSIYVDK